MTWTSEGMRQKWADPIWRARLTAKIKASMEDWHAENGRVGGPKVIVTRSDHLTHAALARIAKKRRISISELVRQYIAWGLDLDGVS